MSEAEPDALTFWPPEGGVLRRWRLHLGLYNLLPLLGVGGVLAGLYTGSRLVAPQPFELIGHLRRMACPVGGAIPVALFLIFALPRRTQARATRTMADALARAQFLLRPGEELEVLCFANFLGSRGYAPGFLLITRERVLRMHLRAKDVVVGEVGAPGELCFARTVRRSNRVGAYRFLLNTMGSDQGLWIEGPERDAFLATDRFILDPLCVWLEERGYAVDFRNDEDREEARLPTALPLVEVAAPPRFDPGMGARLKVAIALVALLLLLLALMS